MTYVWVFSDFDLEDNVVRIYASREAAVADVAKAGWRPMSKFRDDAGHEVSADADWVWAWGGAWGNLEIRRHQVQE